ncbi:MAG TPA: zf-HC2 domain-containing protein [Trebonia sp.]
MTCPMMMSLGVYVLDAADSAERRRLEDHLPGCQECQTELRRLAPLPGLLAGLPASFRPATPSPVRQAGQPSRAPAHGRARRRWATAAAACLAVGVGGGLWLSGVGRSQATTLTLTGTNPATHVTATATLTATSWGSSIQLQVSGLPENVECRLIVRSLSGRSEVSGAWDAWQKGPVSIPASASWLPSGIASLQVTTTAKSLVTMSTSHQPPESGQ